MNEPASAPALPHAGALPRDGEPDRALGPALGRGWRLRCPACGEGRMLQGYVRVRDACPACGAELHHQRADDGPSYLTILIVGHLLAPVMLWSYTAFRPEPWVLTSVFVAASVGLSVWLLPRMKGMMVAFQWARRMHGFGDPAPERQG
jgi:uncharacterized protein (DUF983 family)